MAIVCRRKVPPLENGARGKRDIIILYILVWLVFTFFFPKTFCPCISRDIRSVRAASYTLRPKHPPKSLTRVLTKFHSGRYKNCLIEENFRWEWDSETNDFLTKYITRSRRCSIFVGRSDCKTGCQLRRGQLLSDRGDSSRIYVVVSGGSGRSEGRRTCNERHVIKMVCMSDAYEYRVKNSRSPR